MKRLVVVLTIAVLGLGMAIVSHADTVYTALENYTVNLYGGDGLLASIAWHKSGEKLVCVKYTGEVYWYDLGLRPAPETLPLTELNVVPLPSDSAVDIYSSVSWYGEEVVFTTTKDTGVKHIAKCSLGGSVTNVLSANQLSPESSEVLSPIVWESQLWVCASDGVYCGNLAGSAVTAIKKAINGSFRQLCLSDDGTMLLALTNDFHIWLFSGVDQIATGQAGTVESLSDERCFPVDVSDGFKWNPQFSKDGTLIFYIKDQYFSYVLGSSDFGDSVRLDIMTTTTDSVTNRRPNIKPFGRSFTQATAMSFRAGGIAVAVIDPRQGHVDGPAQLYIASLATHLSAELVGGSVIADPQDIRDGSYGRIQSDPGTVTTNAGSLMCSFWIIKPVFPTDWPGDVKEERSLEPSGGGFDPPLRVTLPTGDIDPSLLAGVSRSSAKSSVVEMARVLEVGDHFVVLECRHFSEIGLALDSDRDGLADMLEAQMGTDPLVSDTDHDGMLDGDEVAGGYDPLDPLSFKPEEPEQPVPVGNWVAPVLFVVLGALVAMRLRKSRATGTRP